MRPTNKEYNKMTKKLSPPSPKWKDFLWAYLVGGLICLVGQLLSELYKYFDLPEKTVKMAVPVTLIFIAALLTGLKVWSKIAKRAGAGALVPITGFANSVVSSAIEYQTEGQVFGIGCKIFTIAGPVILYGIVTSWVLGVIYWIGKMMGIV